MSEMTGFIKRFRNSVDCLFTLHEWEEGQLIEHFTRLPARSGQAGYTNTNWFRGKSPIPIGEHWLHLSPRQTGQKGGASQETSTGIGEFWPISSDLNQTSIIWGPNGEIREHIGLHWENRWKGSAGCPVLQWDTPEREARVESVMETLRKKSKTIKAIRLKVFF